MAPCSTSRRSVSSLSAEVDEKIGPERGRLHRRLQDELDELLRKPQEDWSKVRDLMCHLDTLDPNYTDSNSQMTTLMRCSYAGEADILNWCIQKGADIGACSAIGRSALHYACNANKVGCIRILLEKGADPNLPSLAGETPLHICCIYGSYEAALEILFGTQGVIDINAEDSRRLIPEAMTSDKKILRAIRKYRETHEERRKADLIQHGLSRTMNSDVGTPPGQPGQSQHVARQKVGGHLPKEEGVSDLVVHLSDLKKTIFSDALKSPEKKKHAGEHCKTPLMTPRFKEATGLKSDLRPFRSGAHAILGLARMRNAEHTPRFPAGAAAASTLLRVGS